MRDWSDYNQERSDSSEQIQCKALFVQLFTQYHSLDACEKKKQQKNFFFFLLSVSVNADLSSGAVTTQWAAIFCWNMFRFCWTVSFHTLHPHVRCLSRWVGLHEAAMNRAKMWLAGRDLLTDVIADRSGPAVGSPGGGWHAACAFFNLIRCLFKIRMFCVASQTFVKHSRRKTPCCPGTPVPFHAQTPLLSSGLRFRSTFNPF